MTWKNSYLQTVMALANAIEAKDPYTKGHTERVAALSSKIAASFKLSEQEKNISTLHLFCMT